MFNMISKTVTCDTCRKSIPVMGPARRKAIVEVESEGWQYSGIGQFWCPKCKKKKKK